MTVQHFFEFLQNAALPVLGAVVYAWLRGVLAAWPRLAREAAEGLCCAVLTILCMSAPLVLIPGVQLDARNAVIGIATLFGGPISGLITTAAAVAYRLWLGGIGAPGGAAIAIVAYALVLGLFAWLRVRREALDYRHIALLALAIAISLSVGLVAQPSTIAVQVLMKAGLPGLTIVPGSALVLGAIVVMFERARRSEQHLLARQSELRRQQRALMEIMRANVFMERPLAFSDAVRALTESAGEVLDVAYCQVWQVDETANLAHCLDEWDRGTARHGLVPDADLSQYGKLLADFEREQVIAVTDLAHDERFAARRDVAAARGASAGILAGVFLGGRLLGHVGFVHVGGQRQWTEEELSFARSVADIVALMLVTSQHRKTLAALDLVADGIYVEREDGRIIYANRAALALGGLPEIVGPRYDGAEAFPRVAEPLEGERDLHDIEWNRGGAEKDLEIRRTKFPGGGIVTVIADVTQKNAEQRERDRLQTQLQQASKMEAIGQLASGIAHDFNNLLGAVIGFARFLEQDLPADSPQHGFARRILSACNRGRELVSQILAFTRAHTLGRRPVDLRAVLAESRDLLAGSLPQTSRLAVEAGAAPLVVEASEGQIQQVVVNLCLNAHDALAGQPGDVSVALSKVAPGAADYRRTLLVGEFDPSRPYARLQVSDTGSGIPSENLPRIFEPFFTTKERGRGTGLGLAVVHGILASYGGACAVESRPGAGTRFSVYLPLAATQTVEAASESARRDPRGGERILIVDDEVDLTDVLAIGLERLGYEVAAINDPGEALEVFAESPGDWDAVVTDQLMPGMHGLALAEKLKSIRPDVAVILCTGLDDGAIAGLAKARGVDAFFVKPVEPEQIAAAIRRLAPA